MLINVWTLYILYILYYETVQYSKTTMCISTDIFRPKVHNAGCDFILPDVHLLSVYLLVKILKWKKHE